MKILNKIGYLLAIMAFGIELFCKGYVTEGYVINPEEYGVWEYYYWDIFPLVSGFFNPILIMLLTLISIVFLRQALKVPTKAIALCNAALSVLIIIISNNNYKLGIWEVDLYNISAESPIPLIFMVVLVINLFILMLHYTKRIFSKET